ncbi:sigma-70 family RNA polymerase sigma factor [Mucilaginibacter sp. CAU 1740]|uniref:sigma-70 family RNA polymerase sigma factor n=1 Tax=Mucilaginibacter sp. CAU 1740 TaxID=3140365 RepID=UPI00325ADFA2
MMRGKNRPGNHLAKDQAFIDLFNAHWAGVFQLCRRYTGDEVIAQDLTQEIFLSLLEREMNFETDTAAAQYLAKAARYKVMNYLRDRKVLEPATAETGATNRTETDRYNPETIYLASELAGQLALKIEALEEPARTMFLLNRQQEMSYREIAEQFGVAVKTVEKHMSRALRSLRAIK